MTGELAYETVSYTEKAIKAPKLFKLSSLQDECYKQFGWTSKRTLEELQQLYEAHLVSHPRTDKAYFNDRAIAKEGHTAIIPTGMHASLAGDSKKLYELVDRRFRAIFAPVKKARTVKVAALLRLWISRRKSEAIILHSLSGCLPLVQILWRTVSVPDILNGKRSCFIL